MTYGLVKNGRLQGRLEEVENGWLYFPQWNGKDKVIPLIWKPTKEEMIKVLEGELIPINEL